MNFLPFFDCILNISVIKTWEEAKKNPTETFVQTNKRQCDQLNVTGFSLFLSLSQVIGEPCGYHGPYTFYKGIRISPYSSTSSASLTAAAAAAAAAPLALANNINNNNAAAAAVAAAAAMAAIINANYENHGIKNNHCFDGMLDLKTAELLRSNDTIIKSIKHEYDSESSSDSGRDSALHMPRKFTKTQVKPRLLAEWYEFLSAIVVAFVVSLISLSDVVAAIAVIVFAYLKSIKNCVCVCVCLREWKLNDERT